MKVRSGIGLGHVCRFKERLIASLGLDLKIDEEMLDPATVVIREDV